MRWRVGRRPTARSIALTSCHGQPVSAGRVAVPAIPSATAVAVLRMTLSGGDMGTPGHSYVLIATTVALVTYRSEDATAPGRGWKSFAMLCRAWLLLVWALC